MADETICVHWLPISVFVALPLTFITTFAIAVGLGHVEADFPYISDTGTTSPESCIFGQLLNVSAVLVGLNFYIRYKQVEHHLSHHENMRLRRLNKVSLVLGLLSAFGISMVGNFQETNVLIAHLIGAVLAFGVSAIYCVMHTVISYKTHPHLSSLRICHLRALLCLLIIVTFIGMFVLDSVAKKHYHGTNPRKWYPDDGGFTYHVLSTASEWTMAGSYLIFFLTFVTEFRHLRLTPPIVNFVELTNSGLDTRDDGDVNILT